MADPPQPGDEMNPYVPPRSPIDPPPVAVQVTRMDPWVILLSFLITSTLGGWLLFTHWSLEGQRVLGIMRGVGFVVIMAGVHFVGSRIYARQPRGTGT